MELALPGCPRRPDNFATGEELQASEEGPVGRASGVRPRSCPLPDDTIRYLRLQLDVEERIRELEKLSDHPDAQRPLDVPDPSPILERGGDRPRLTCRDINRAEEVRRRELNGLAIKPTVRPKHCLAPIP